MPPELFSINAIICEKVLNEADQVLSTIRIVDVFYWQRVPDVPLERQAVGIQVLVMAKFELSVPEGSEHSFTLELIRPNGDCQQIGEALTAKLPKKELAEAPSGVNLVAPIGILPKIMGLHVIRVLLNGKEAAKIPFTLVERQAPTTH